MSEKEKLIDKLKLRTPLYSSLDISYQQEYSGPFRDLSLITKDVIVIISEKDGKLTGFGRPAVSIGNQKLARAYVCDLTKEYKDIWYMGFEVDSVTQFLMEKGYRYKPYFTQILDLTKSVEELYTDLRKSYKQLVKQDDYILSVDLRPLRQQHFDMHGKTRSDATWNIQNKMISDKEAFIVTAGGTSVLTYVNNLSAYYACVGANGNAHTALWMSILTAKHLGCNTYEMGEQVFYGDKKEMNISKFKRGFGGRTETRIMIGEK